MSMRGVYTNVVEIRQKVFTEVARMAFEGGDYSRIIDLPYKIIPGEVATYRESVFLEGASAAGHRAASPQHDRTRPGFQGD